jgi:predicted MFS family arabinose efflux permease
MTAPRDPARAPLAAPAEPPFAGTILPLAALNLLNQASRALVAVIGPLLALEFGLSASELGMLAAAFFASYALTQLPVGLALDLFGSRRVQTVLALVAGAGFALSAVAEAAWLLAVGRFITGIGVAAGFMAMIKTATEWYPRHRIAAVTGTGVFIGAAGGLLATVPAQWLLPHVGWRGLFALLAAAGLLVAVWIRLVVPEAPPGDPPRRQRRKLGVEVAEFGRIFTHRAFLRLVPAVALMTGLTFTYQGLWAGPWLRDVGGMDEEARAAVLFCFALGLMAGSLLNSRLASALQRRGADPMLVPYGGLAAMIAVQLVLALASPADPLLLTLLWTAFAYVSATGPASFAAVGHHFPPELSGRVATAINATMLVLVFALQWGIGAILDLWPRTAAGGWDPAGYAWALLMTAALQAASALWLVVAPRPGPADGTGSGT